MVVPYLSGISYGTDAATGQPVNFDRNAHRGKMVQIRGETGGGKSVLLAWLLKQYLQPHRLDGTEVQDVVVIVDLGGDLFTYNLVKAECERLGRVFRWLSLDPLDQTYYFDPLDSCKCLQGSTGRMANFVTAGLNLAYGEGFGSAYFGRLNLSTIRQAFVRLRKKGVAAPTLVELAEELFLMASQARNAREAAEALYALDQLLDYPALTRSPDPELRINIDHALEECHVLYFFLPTLQEPLAARAVGTLAAWSVINTAAHRQKTGQPKRTIQLVIDEAAQIVHGQSFQDALVLCRKYGIRIHIVHQSEAQLRSARGTDMSQVVKDNCAIKALFTTDTGKRSGELDDLQSHSKLEKVPRLGTSLSGLRATTSEQEQDEPKLKRDDVLDVNKTFGRYYLLFNDGKGHREPIEVISTFPTTQAEYERLSSTPLPRKSVELPETSLGADELVKQARTPVAPPEAKPAKNPKLRELLKQLKAEEAWRLSA